MSLKLTHDFSTPRPTHAGAKWIDLKEAAKRSGWNEGYIRRLCGDRWMAQGMAELRTPPSGGKSTWFVREDADERLARVKFAEQMSRELDMRELTSKQRETILFRERTIQEWLTARAGAIAMGITADAATTQFLIRLEVEKHLRVSKATLYNWHKAWRAGGRKGLMDGRTEHAAEKADATSPFYDYLRDLYLTPRKLSKTICYHLAEQKAIEMGWQFPSQRTARRFLEQLPKPLVVKKREGDDAYVAKCEPYISRDYSTINSNDQWCGDHHRFDVMVVKPDGTFDRPWITGWQDMRSRKIVGYHIFLGDPNTDTILLAFAKGVKSHGLPSLVYVDNGKDYDARALQGETKQQRRARKRQGLEIDRTRVEGAFAILGGIDTTHCWEYHGQSKPIERAFGTLCSRFSKLCDTYCGKDTQSKPENLKEQMQAGKAMTLEEFAAAFGEWLEHDYHGRLHLGNAMDASPAEVWEKCLIEKRVVPEDLLEFACLPRVVPVKVGRQGVTWQGLHYGGFDASIQKLFGEKVKLAIDPANVTRVLVLTEAGKLVGSAALNKSIPVNADKATLKQAIQEKKQNRKAHREYQQRRPRMADDMHTLLTRAAIRKKNEDRQVSEPQPPAPLKHVQTPFDDQLRAVAQAMRPDKIAVGAEAFDPRLVSDAFRPTTAETDSEPSTFNVLSQALNRGISHE